MGANQPTVAGRDLGAELRALREQRKLTTRGVAQKLGWAPSKISKIETGKQGTRPEDVASMLAVYGITGKDRDYLVSKAGKVDKPGLWEKTVLDGGLSRETSTLMRLERKAVSIQSAEPVLVPGLLQSPDYTRALMKACRVPDSDIELRIATRMSRQAILSSTQGPTFHTVVDEGVLRRMLLPPKLMARQLRHLVETAERPNVTIQVLPFSLGGHSALDGSFTLLDFARKKSVVALDHKICALFLEEEREIQFFRDELVNLHEIALTPDESIGFIARVIKELDQ